LFASVEGKPDAAGSGRRRGRRRYTAGPDHEPVPVAAIDAGAVTFISSAGVALMLRWAQAASTDGRPVLLRRSARCVDRVLQQMGLHAQFHS
jgi:anti-anti-sigma regulatory factor